MHTMSLIDIDTITGASYVYINGQINLNQKSPISSGTLSNTKLYKDLFNNITSPLDYSAIYDEYTYRNLTTPIKYDKLIMPYNTNRDTTIELDITIPHQTILYTTPIYQLLKVAWVQYLSLFLPGSVMVYLILLFIFKFQVYESAVINNLPK